VFELLAHSPRLVCPNKGDTPKVFKIASFTALDIETGDLQWLQATGKDDPSDLKIFEADGHPGLCSKTLATQRP